jgi:hypothetical protein
MVTSSVPNAPVAPRTSYRILVQIKIGGQHARARNTYAARVCPVSDIAPASTAQRLARQEDGRVGQGSAPISPDERAQRGVGRLTQQSDPGTRPRRLGGRRSALARGKKMTFVNYRAAVFT